MDAFTPDEVTQLLSELVAIDSTNPVLVPGGAGEAEMAAFIASWLEKAGLEVQLVETAPGRPNVVGIARGQGGGRTLVLNGHMDTVGTGEMKHAHTPRVLDGRLYGRGAYDMKGGLAACMLAAAEATKAGLRGDVILQAVVDEEYASIGTQALAPRFKADGAIVAEFTELKLIVAHKGFVWLEVETTGTAAHGSRPDLGVDAIVKMGRVLAAIEQLDQTLRSKPVHPLLWSGSVHASLIKGGRELSSYPEQCILSIERRTLPGETHRTAKEELVAIVRELEQADPTFKGLVRRGLDRLPLETPESEDVFIATRAAASRVLGKDPQIAGVPFWTDAALLSAAGIPSILFGPSGAGAHAAEEWVDLASVKACAEVYLATALDFCS
jgi:acetylornithine deacetylase